MLFTDSDIVSSADLIDIDGEIPDVANNMKPPVTVDGPGSVCEQAWREAGQQITAAQQIYSSYLATPGMSTGHTAAVNNTGVPARTQPRIRLNQIVAHDQTYASSKSAIQIWMAYMALRNFYRNASSRLGKDRFQEKMLRYQEDTLHRWRELRATGLPFVYQNFDAPGAKHSFNAGVWNSANVTTAAAGGLAGGNFVAAITWYDSSKYVSQSVKANAESGPSQIQAIAPATNMAIKVDITSLNPPTGAADPVGTALGTLLPLNATHWNIWVGAAPNDPNVAPVLYLQKESVPIATKSFTLTTDPVLSGSVLTQGQFSESNLAFQNLVQRA